MPETDIHVKFWRNMLQAMTVVAMLRLLADGVEVPCNPARRGPGGSSNGGGIHFERVRGYTFKGNVPPFRKLPERDYGRRNESQIDELRMCQLLALGQGGTTGQGSGSQGSGSPGSPAASSATSSSQQPSSRDVVAFVFTPGTYRNENFDPSMCEIFSSSVHGEGLMRIMTRDPRNSKSLFNPLCLSSSRRADCRNRMYAFETQFQAGFDRKLADPPQKMPSREECADACLNSYNTVCRHAMYDVSSQDCYMSSNFSVEISYTPEMQDMIYMENACLTDERECPTEEGIGIEIKTAEELGYSPDASGSSGLPDIDSRDRPRDRQHEDSRLVPGLLLHPFTPRDEQRGSRFEPSGPRNRIPDARQPPTNTRDWDNRERTGRVSATTMDECLAGCKRFEAFKCRTVIHYYERAGPVGRDGRPERLGLCLLTDMELTSLSNSDKMMLAEYAKRQGAEIKDHPCRRTRSLTSDPRALDNQPVFGPGGRGYIVKENFVMIPGYKMETRGMEKSYAGSPTAQDCLEECLKANNNRGRCEAISYSGIRRECYLADESPRRARLIRDDDFQIYELKAAAAAARSSPRAGGPFNAATPFDNRFYWKWRAGGPSSGGPPPPPAHSRDYFGQRGGASSSSGGWRSGSRDEWWGAAGGREEPFAGRPPARPWPSASDRDRDRERDRDRDGGVNEYERNREVYERTRERNRGQTPEDRDKFPDDRRNGTDGDNWRQGSNWVSTSDDRYPGRRDWWSSGSRWGASQNGGWQSGSQSGSRYGDRDRYGPGGDQPVGGSPGDPQSNRWGSSSSSGGYWGSSRDRDRWSDWRGSGNNAGAFPGGSWGGGFAGGSTGVIGGGAGGGPYGWRNCDTPGAAGGASGRHYQKMEVGYRLKRTYVDRYADALAADDCMRLCDEEPGCRAFNYLADFSSPGRQTDNCQLSSRGERNLNDPLMFERDPKYDYYIRQADAAAPGAPGFPGNCIDVSFSCDTEAMEFTLSTPEEFRGIIYTYNYYDRCYYQGKGDRISVFRIPADRGFQECGTRRYEDMMTNIVVVQFDERLLTTHDRKYNLTCRFSLDGETVVTSGYTQVLGVSSRSSALPIEYLPAQYIDLLNVELRIMYNGRATNNIAVGDPLMFTLEARGSGYSFGYYSNDIFATNVIARDPYSGRSILLIDDRGCAVEPMIFPPLERVGDGRLQAYFEAFNIPEADFLVFEATIRPCRDGCPPARCTIYGREVPSWGRRRRDVAAAIADGSTSKAENTNQGEEGAPADYDQYSDQPYPVYGDYYYGDSNATDTNTNTNSTEPPKHVMGVFRIYNSRDEIKDEDATASPLHVCIAPVEYRGLLATMGVLLVLLLGMAAFSGILYRKYRQLRLKHAGADSSSPYGYSMSGGSTSDRISTMSGISSQRSFGLSRPSNTRPTMAKACALPKPKLSFFSSSSAKNNAVDKDDPYGLTIGAPPPVGGKQFQDPSEPIYADPSLFERSRSLRSVSPSDCGRIRQAPNMGDSVSTAYAAPSGCRGNSGDDDQ